MSGLGIGANRHALYGEPSPQSLIIDTDGRLFQFEIRPHRTADSRVRFAPNATRTKAAYGLPS
jgi:hypothetical protein